MENLRRQLHKGTEICSSIELLGVGEAVREAEEGVEETLLFKLVNGTDVVGITEAEVATNSDEESYMLVKAKRGFLLQVEQLQSVVEWRTWEDSAKSKQNLRLKRNYQDPRLFSKVLVEQKPQPDAILPL